MAETSPQHRAARLASVAAGCATLRTERAVREVMDHYRKRFEQEAVLRVRLPACTSFR